MLLATLVAAAASLQLPEAPVPERPVPPPPAPVVTAPDAGPPPEPVEEADPREELDPGDALKDLWDRIDALRARGAICGGRPLPPVPRLRGSVPLDTAAEGQATFMAESGVWEHETPGNPAGETPQARVKQAKYRGKLAGEVLAWGQGTAAEAVRWWLDSPPHCEALMDPFATHGGAAMVPDPESGGYVWVVVLGRKR